MKKIICLALTLLVMSVGAIAQDDAPKKKGGFWNKVKKGVESATGIDVSKETLFVYPEIGKWQMQLASATGDPATGVVKVVFKVTPLGGQGTAALRMTSVTDGNGKVLKPGTDWEEGSNSYPLAAGAFTEYPLRRITVSPDVKSLKTIEFIFEGARGFEARDVPISWTPATE